jgi:hypothetical protein
MEAIPWSRAIRLQRAHLAEYLLDAGQPGYVTYVDDCDGRRRVGEVPCDGATCEPFAITDLRSEHVQEALGGFERHASHDKLWMSQRGQADCVRETCGRPGPDVSDSPAVLADQPQ